MVSYFILCFFLFYLFVSLLLDRKYIFYIWPVILCLTPPTLLVIDTPSLPILSVNRAILFFFFGVAFCEWCIRLKISFSFRNPLAYGLIFVFSSYLITLLLTGFQGFSSALGFFLEALFPMVMYSSLYKVEAKDHRLNLVILFITFFLFGLYGCLSFITDYNPYLDVLRETIHTERVSIITYENDWRGARALGTFGHPMTFGAIMGLGILLGSYLSMSSAGREKVIYMTLSFFMLFFLFYSNSRSPLILVMVGVVFIFLGFNLVLKLLSAFLFIVTCVLAFNFSDYFKSKVYSVVNIFMPTIGEDMRGSTIDMRITQMKVAFNCMMQNPIWGNGIGFTRYLVESKTEPGLLNSESAIFPIMIDQGIVGVLAYAMLFVAIIYSFNHKIKNRLRWTVFGIVGGYVSFILATGFLYTFPFFLYLILVLYYDYNNQNAILLKTNNPILK